MFVTFFFICIPLAPFPCWIWTAIDKIFLQNQQTLLLAVSAKTPLSGRPTIKCEYRLLYKFIEFVFIQFAVSKLSVIFEIM
jgi:hypothetical protein